MVWSGDKDVDWLHVRQILKDLQIDGRHIAIWRQWLSPPRSTPGMFDRDKENPPTSSGIPVSADPSDFTLRDRDCAEAVLRAYVCFNSSSGCLLTPPADISCALILRLS